MLFCFVIVVLLSLLMINLLSNFQNFLKLPSIKHVMKSGQITHFSYLTKSPLIIKQFSYLMLTIHMYKNYDISSFTYQAIWLQIMKFIVSISFIILFFISLIILFFHDVMNLKYYAILFLPFNIIKSK